MLLFHIRSCSSGADFNDFTMVKHLFQSPLNHGDTYIRTSVGNIRLADFSQFLFKYQSDIANTCPDISISMIERTLKEMLDKGEIIKVGSGRTTSYVKK